MPRLSAEEKQQRAALRVQMRQMYEDGKTYKDIGDTFGLSKQRIFQMIGRGDVKLFRKITPKQCVYKGIRKFMNDNNVSIHELTRRIYGSSNPGNYQRTKGRLDGTKELVKEHIDKLLAITGLTYEAAFEIESEVV